ncbi:MAG: hypothetical protein Q7K57_20575 [Burkholderiaceae bacterium]|nr:hypothetical protein [Burkholderiaceae bacterium]
MARIYYYKLTTDDGGAPCVLDGLLSLGICKPMIRSTAKKEDLIFGFAANSLYADNRLLYIARVTDKVREGKYYTSGKFEHRGDCIYERHRDRFQWRQGALHHGPRDLVHDLGSHPDYDRANVLLSDDFRYFGANGSSGYKYRYPLIKDAVEHLGQGHRVYHDESLRIALLTLMKQVWRETRRKVSGEQTSTPRRGACHRSKSYGMLGDSENG